MRDNWHMNHALECNHVRCVPRVRRWFRLRDGRAAVAIAYYAHNAK